MDTDLGNNYGAATPGLTHEGKRPLQIDKPAGQRLEIVVIFTDTPGTLAALKMAEALGQELEVSIRLLVPCEVPYTLPLAKPMVPVEFLEDQIRNLAGNTPLEVEAQIYLCRDKRRTLELLLERHSLIVVGGKKRWWPTSAQNLARDLQQDGRHVIFAELR